MYRTHDERIHDSLMFMRSDCGVALGNCCSSHMENRGLLSHSRSENNGIGDSNREQSSKRRKILKQKKVIDQLIDVACAQKDHLSPFPSFHHFNCGGLSLYLQSGHGDKLSYSVKKGIQNLLKINMEGPYGSQWPTEEKVKHREMVSTQAHYIFVHEASNANANGMSSKSEKKTTPTLNKKDPMVAFVHFRFIIEETIPVLYVYELQIEPRFQGRGLGTFVMELIELIACKNYMGAVVFTVQKANSKALNFYQSKLRYSISSISPSRVNLLVCYALHYHDIRMHAGIFWSSILNFVAVPRWQTNQAMKFFARHLMKKLKLFWRLARRLVEGEWSCEDDLEDDQGQKSQLFLLNVRRNVWQE